ncbi:GNAT family N-acetyltransferase [Erwinia sp. S43]|uniref:GNAT family N-acetyltransferase n=1 Tax=Erwiniaceae TaxID=1903409 RepID=UPI00190E0D8F|nr:MULTISPECIES: GNAT family N-acetyltransferase [Erwiniaceae]MBK0002083.1 GNAT family N-acetyltransferase [Erwinia sp. S38]MBK0033745.1 GNAT family N-acetyltransferase [Erwinia sp. S43]MBM7343821.1 GNAT superfamily N-acetyltransferase [Pantoea coffeiphila]MCW1874103.1 GNAT family N-acetyltransferase [Erwinia sp. INIA01]
MIIRPYTEADRPFLRTLFLAARRHSWTWLDDSDWRLEDFDHATLGERILVAELDGHRVGFAAVLEQDNFLHSLFVDPEWQGSGAGSALLQAVQRSFTSTGALKCLAENLQAQSFYKKHGWRTVAQGESEQGEYLLMHFVL